MTLDVLDPSVYGGVKCPVQDGLTTEELMATIDTIRSRTDLKGMSVLENTEQDFDAIARIGELLSAGRDL